MNELIEKLEHVSEIPADSWLIDTCYFIYAIKHHKDIQGYLTSFNAEELIHVEHHMDDDVKRRTRKILKAGNIKILDIDVHPGNPDAEHKYVDAIDPELLKHVHDPSDAVLVAAAIKHRSNIRTRDKHHLYTAELNNFLNASHIKVEN